MSSDTGATAEAFTVHCRTTLEERIRAARYVLRRGRDAADARLLCDMLGLAEEAP